jgi:MFS transporter, DHA1 family, inner membrane transport protein
VRTTLREVNGDSAADPRTSSGHSAFNVANALGPWLAGMAIAAGFGSTSTGWVGCGLALAGFAVWFAALIADGGHVTAAVRKR